MAQSIVYMMIFKEMKPDIELIFIVNPFSVKQISSLYAKMYFSVSSKSNSKGSKIKAL